MSKRKPKTARPHHKSDSVTEVWAIEMGLGVLVCPALDDDGTESFLAWPSKEQAEQGLEFQQQNYGIKGRIVRLSPPEEPT